MVSNSETSAIYNSDPDFWDTISGMAREVAHIGRRDGVRIAHAAAAASATRQRSCHIEQTSKTVRGGCIGPRTRKAGDGTAPLVCELTSSGTPHCEGSAWVKSWNTINRGRRLSELYVSADSVPDMVKILDPSSRRLLGTVTTSSEPR